MYKYFISITCIYTNSERMYPKIYNSWKEANISIDGLPYSKIHNKFTIYAVAV